MTIATHRESAWTARAARRLLVLACSGALLLACGETSLPGGGSAPVDLDVDEPDASDASVPEDVPTLTPDPDPDPDPGPPPEDVPVAAEDVPPDAPCPPAPECDDADPCTADSPVGPSETCEWACEYSPITPCCGNAQVEEGELCDGDCPAVCDDQDPCTGDVQSGAPETCNMECSVTQGDPGTDSDGDSMTDCVEATDGSATTDPLIFNGLLATIGEPPSGTFTSAQCNLFFGNSYGELLELFDESEQAQSIWAGWEYSAGKTNDYDDPAEFDFEPNWDNAKNGGAYSSFQIWFTGVVHVADAGTWCFSVDTGSGGFGPLDIAGRRNCCGRVYIDPQPSSSPLAETGYGSAASPNTGCVELSAGPHAIDIAARHYETYFYAPKLQVRHCFGGAGSCTPDQPLTADILHAPTSGEVPPDPPPDGGDKGACVNAADTAVLEGLGDDGLQSKITACGTDCFFGADKVACVQGCIETDIGLSTACAACYAAITGCVFEHCVSACISQGPGCDQCMADNGCQADFPACSGLE